MKITYSAYRYDASLLGWLLELVQFERLDDAIDYMTKEYPNEGFKVYKNRINNGGKIVKSAVVCRSNPQTK